MTPGRIMMWVANGLAGVLLAGALLLVLLEHTWPVPPAYGPKDAFEKGSIGTEFIPLPAFLALPKVFPELFPADWMAHYGFLPGGPAGLPIGFTVEYARPVNGSPSPVPFIGLACAVCHTNRMRYSDGKEQTVAGLGNTELDVAPFFEAFRIAMLARDDQGNPVLTIGRIAEVSNMTLLQRAVTWAWLLAARNALEQGQERHDVPLTGDTLRNPIYQTTGPGRTNPFNTMVTNVLRLPNTSSEGSRPNYGYSRIPAVWQENRRQWAQYDGSISDLDARSALAALTVGATVENLGRPNITANIRAATNYTRTLSPPKFPKAPDAAAAARGKALYTTACADCHGTPDGNGGWTRGARQGQVIPLPEIGTDPERVTFRHARLLADRLYTMFSVDYPRDYNRIHPLATPRAATRPGPAGNNLGYIAQPIEGAALRGPYLHNASVPNLSALINLTPRPTVFARGLAQQYDTGVAGIVPTATTDASAYWLFDTRLPGNSAAGHEYPWRADDPARNPAQLADLLAYLETF
jgi:cytochrome c553